MKKEIIIYQSKSGKIEFQGDLKKDTIWGNLNQIAELFGRDKSVISRHIKNIFKSLELQEKSTVTKIATVQKEGKREVVREIEYYNLDMILSIGYRVNSKQATQFRIWATKTLKQHLLEGYTINKKQLAKNYQKFQAVVQDLQTLLPKSSSLLSDGNKRSGAFAFVWFLKKAGCLSKSLTPPALTALTLLIAESNPKDKDKMIGLILLLFPLQKRKSTVFHS